MDFNILYFIDGMHSELLDKIMILFTNLGDGGIFWILLALILVIFRKTRKCGILMLVSMLCGVIVGNGILKNIVRRSRPCWLDTSIPLLIPNPSDFSFPSGHTLASFEAAIMIFLHSKKWGIPAILLALVIAFSRLYLFVHFPSDVLGGAILGTVISIATYYIYEKKIAPKLKEKKDIKE